MWTVCSNPARISCLLVATLSLALAATAAAPAAAGPAELKNLTGRWQTASGSVVEIGPADGDDNNNGRLVGRLIEPSVEALSQGFGRGEVVLMDLAVSGGGKLTASVALHPQRVDVAERTPVHYAPASAALGEAPVRSFELGRAPGRFNVVERDGAPDAVTYVEEPGDPVVMTFTRIEPRPPRLEIVDVSVRGSHGVVPEPADVVNPVLPRFFVNERGRASVDLDADLVAAARAITVIAADPSGGNGDDIARYTIPPNRKPAANAVSGGRWVTIDLHDTLASSAGFSLYEQEEGVRLRVEVTLANGGIVKLDAPPADRFRVLRWMHDRAGYLSGVLFDRSLADARKLTREEREELAWRRLIGSDAVRVVAELRNPSGDEPADEPVLAFALFARGGGRWDVRRLELADERVAVGPGESERWDARLPLHIWPAEDVSRFGGVWIVVGPGEGENALPAEPPADGSADDGRSRVVRFTLDTEDPRRLAARTLDGLRLPGETHAAVARRFLVFDSPNLRGTESMRKAVKGASEWAATLAEFEALLERIDGAFATVGLGRLNEAVSAHAGAVHVGAPGENRGPTIFDPNRVAPGWKVYNQFELEKPGSESFMRGLIAAATGGRAAGDLPLVDDPESLRRALAERPEVPVIHSSHTWQTPKHYIDAFRQLSPEEAKALAAALNAKQPLESIQGEVAEGLFSREHGRRWVREYRQRGRQPIYLNGWSLRDYNFRPGANVGGQKVGDGLLLSVEGSGKVRVHHIVEIKSGTAGVDEIVDQLAKHERRFRENGVTIVNPTRHEVEYFGRLGVQPRPMEIAGRREQVLHIEPSRLVFDEGNALRQAVTAADVDAPGGGRRVSLARARMADLAADLMALHGMRATAWDEPRLGLRGYREFYQQLVARGLGPARPVSPDELTRLYLSGMRFDPGSKSWRRIYDAPEMMNTDPFMSKDDFIKAFRAQRKTSPTAEQVRNAEQRFNEGWRWNPTRQWHKPAHLIDPHDPGLTADEHTRYWRAVTRKPTLSEREAAEKFRAGYVYDPARRNWVKRETDGFQDDPAFDRDLRRSYRRQRTTAGAAAAAEAVDMINAGLREVPASPGSGGAVQVRQKENSEHLFLIVHRGEVGNSGEVERWYEVGSPELQQFMLVQWYRGGQGFFGEGELPDWLARAQPDGPSHTWWGLRISAADEGR